MSWLPVYAGIAPVIFLLFSPVASNPTPNSDVVVLTDTNFDEHVASGQWMIKIYAPWCVHCKALEPTWEQLATKLKPQGLKVAKINGVSEKVLLARFRIEAFPSIFHIAGGETREYNGGRSLEALEQFAQTRWRKEDPLPIWRNPAHIISRGLGHVYGLPALLQKAYHHFNRDLGYSELTILVGALSIPLALGIFSICLLDAFYSCRTEPVALVAEHPHND